VSLHDKLNQVATDPHSIEIIEKTAAKVSYGASAGTVYVGFTADEWGIIGIITGIVLGVATFSFNCWFRMKYMRPNNDEKQNLECNK
jgi:hypothetical protein